jgi:hypothetical protein
MAFSVSPSVIVREVDATAGVPAIATPPAAIAGVFRWGPTEEPILISSENELVGRFGAPTDNTYETFFVAADYLSYSNALYVARADNGARKASGDIVANNVIVEAGSFEGKYPGELGNSIDVAYSNNINFEHTVVEVGDIPANSIITANTQTIDFNSFNIEFEVDALNKINNINAGDILEIGNDSVGYQSLKMNSAVETAIDFEGNPAALELDIVAYKYEITLATRYTLSETNLNALKFTTKWIYASSFGTAPVEGTYHIAVIDNNGKLSGQAGSIVELYENLSTTQGSTLTNGRNNYYVDVINNGSSWVNVANTINFEATSSGYETLTLGTDGTSEATTTLGPLALAYDTFENANEIDISFILQGKGDDNGNLANYIVSNIAEKRKDVVAFLSPSKESVVDELRTNSKLKNVIAYRNKIQSSSYWFMDSGYKYRYDKYNDVYRFVPLNGDMAGLASRVEPYESPAGFRKGVIKNVVKLAFNPNKAQRDQLYSSDINPVVSQIGQGIILFGDKTGLGVQSAFDRINVRRLFIAVEKSIANAAQNLLFDLNDDFTQTQFKNIVDPFLRDIQGRRGIIDFRVVSDATVNTPVIVDQNKFRANIFIKPARSINVIELTFVATRSGIEFDEIVGSIS